MSPLGRKAQIRRRALALEHRWSPPSWKSSAPAPLAPLAARDGTITMGSSSALPFYIYEDAVFDHERLVQCLPHWRLDDQAAEVAMLRQLRSHPARVRAPRLASLFVVPVYPYVSLLAGSCTGTEHSARMAAATAALPRSWWWRRHGGADHLLVTNTFRLNALGGPLRRVLANASVAWFEAPEAPRRGPGTLMKAVTWRCTVVIPYLAAPYPPEPEAALAGERPASVFFQGSLGTAARASPPSLVTISPCRWHSHPHPRARRHRCADRSRSYARCRAPALSTCLEALSPTRP